MICDKYFKNIFLNSGQSLVEVVIGLAIGALIIGGATFAIFAMLTTGVSLQKAQNASALSQGFLDKVRLIAGANWNDIYNLPVKGSSTPYYVIASGTSFFVVNGKEGILDNNITNGLVGYWKFDEATGSMVYDFSGMGNNGMLTKDTNATSVPERYQGITVCKVSGCLKFNGLLGYFAAGTLNQSNWVQVPYSDSLNIQGSAITLAAWIFPLAYPTDFAGIIRTNGWTDGYRLHLLSSGKIGLGLTGISGYNLVSNNIVPLNKWSFVAGVLDNGVMKIYINGEQDPNVKDRPGNIDASITPLFIGLAPEYQSFNGFIDEARVYNRNLSADEIRQLYNSNIFISYFYIDDVCRSGDILTSIVGLSPCNGATLDPSTEKISVLTEWLGQGKTGNVKLEDYVTRWSNSFFRQTDWSAGLAATTTPLVEPNSNFSSSTNIDFSEVGSIKLKGF